MLEMELSAERGRSQGLLVMLKNVRSWIATEAPLRVIEAADRVIEEQTSWERG